jgi:hypothetical protein
MLSGSAGSITGTDSQGGERQEAADTVNAAWRTLAVTAKDQSP